LSKLLLDDKPLIVLPSLAGKVGLNESIVLQQLHYWLLESKNIKDGFKWVYNTYEDWQKQFPFWSVRTLKRIITGLETEELIITGNYNKLKIDRTKWYRINNEKLDSLMERPECQNGTSIVTNWHDGEVNLSPPLPEITTETTTKKYISFADTVQLTQEQYDRLVEEYGKKTVDDYIERLDEWQTNNPRKKKKDHNKTLRVWMKDVKKVEKPKPSSTGAIAGHWGFDE
jgi:hypothetical protein